MTLLVFGSCTSPHPGRGFASSNPSQTSTGTAEPSTSTGVSLTPGTSTGSSSSGASSTTVGASSGTATSARCPPGSDCRLADGGSGFCCSERCVDLRSDSTNCTECGEVCPNYAICNEEGCVYPSCMEPLSTLPGMASFVSAICMIDGGFGACCAGTCGSAACGPQQCVFVQDGTTCQLPTSGWPPSFGFCCGTTCVDPGADPQNCGACGTACPSPESCVRGRCWGLGSCSLSNPNHQCGISDGGMGVCCGTECLQKCPVLTSCAGAPDETLCPNGSGSCCDGICVEEWQDPLNCGGCGIRCASGQCAGNYLGSGQFCIPSPDSGGDCAPQGGCPPGDSCVGGLCLPTSCDGQTLCAQDGGGSGYCCYSRHPPECLARPCVMF